jgi:hypothetical protein
MIRKSRDSYWTNAKPMQSQAMAHDRAEHMRSLYAILDRLERKLGGARGLANCSGHMDWPKRGVYFFKEAGEDRSDSGLGPRIVRIGTHALTNGSTTTLWRRLSQHRGQKKSGGGLHRTSVFRLIVGDALIRRDSLDYPNWGKGDRAPAEIIAAELPLECTVSTAIGAMPMLWLQIDDEPGSGSLRGFIERNAIALLSNYRKPAIDPPSTKWLGSHCERERVRESGLWNSNHVDENYDPAFLERLAQLVDEMKAGA